VDANRIVVRVNEDENVTGEVGVDIYNLVKYTRSNQNTNINQAGPIVKKGDQIAKGRWSSADGRLDRPRRARASARTCWSAFMPWNGYNFEDSILICERVVAEDRYTSIHIEEAERGWARDQPSSARRKSRATHLRTCRNRSLPGLDDSGIVLHRGRSLGRRHAGGPRSRPRAETQLTAGGKSCCARDPSARKSLRREGHLAAGAVRHDRHRDRRAGVHRAKGIQRDKSAPSRSSTMR